jgi:hypothetical protein
MRKLPNYVLDTNVIVSALPRSLLSIVNNKTAIALKSHKVCISLQVVIACLISLGLFKARS